MRREEAKVRKGKQRRGEGEERRDKVREKNRRGNAQGGNTEMVVRRETIRKNPRPQRGLRFEGSYWSHKVKHRHRKLG